MEKLKTVSLLEDHQCQVKLWNLVLGWHATYASGKELIIYPYLRYEQLIISSPSIINNIHDDLTQFFIRLIGFTVKGS